MPPKNKKKSNRGDDSDDDFKSNSMLSETLAALNISDKKGNNQSSSQSNNAKGNKKGNKKGNRGDDDSDDNTPIAKPPASKVDVDSEDEGKKSKAKKGQQQSNIPPSAPVKKEKKGKKGRHGDDSDSDDDNVDPLSIMKKLAEGNKNQVVNENDSDDDDDNTKRRTSSKTKKQPSKNKNSKNEDSDDEGPTIKQTAIKKGASIATKMSKETKKPSNEDSEDDDEDEELEEDSTSQVSMKPSKDLKKSKFDKDNTEIPHSASKTVSKAQQKSSKAVKKGAELEDDEKPIPNTAKTSVNKSTKMKKQDEDESDEDEEDDEIELPDDSKLNKGGQTSSSAGLSAKSEKNSKEDKKVSKKFDDDDSSRQKTASTKSSKKSKGAKKDKIDVDEVDGEVIGLSNKSKAKKVDDRQDDDDDPVVLTTSVHKKSKDKKKGIKRNEIDEDNDDVPETTAKSQTKNSNDQRQEEEDDEEDDEDEDGDATSNPVVTAASSNMTEDVTNLHDESNVTVIEDTNLHVPVPPAAQSLTSHEALPPQALVESKPSSTVTQVKETLATAAPVVATESSSVNEKPKTKLQLKLEKAKKEKELRDQAELIAKKENERLAKLANEEEIKRLALQREQEAKALAEAQLLEEQEEAAKVLESTSAVLVSASASIVVQPVKVEESLTEEERLARLQSTMFGDNVHTEYGVPVVDEDEDDDEGNNKGSSRKKKLSNKERRKQAKEQDSKDREEEERIALMKASIEGAQFAVSQSAINPDDPMWQNALDINIPSLTISAHSKELFSNAELMIAHGRRYGLVGPNGAGKSTLLKMIAYGELKVPPRVDYLYVEQEVMADETPAVDAVLKADKERWNLIQEEKKLLKEIETLGRSTEALDTRLGEIYEELETINASAAESKARRILFGLGFDAEMQVRPTKYFSGGWRMRISLARALFMEPTLLMLDEPTNHLDLNAVIWLDDYLQKWKKTLLVVSHDQDFLNSVCQEILHLDDKKLVVYKGNYDNFKEQEAVKRQQQQKSWEKQEKRIKELKAKGITKLNAEKETLKAKGREPGARSKKKADSAAAALGGLESGETQVELIKRPREYLVTFFFPIVNMINPPILQVRDVNFRYGPNLPWLFKYLSFGLDMSSRVCIVGPNGSGKSTLLKIITGEVNPPEGMVVRNPRLRVGVYNQHFVDRLPMEEDPVAYLRRLFNEESYQSARNLLGRFGLEGHAHTIPIRDLSGGQKARVVFAELSLMAPHILFLDEPTNNLDIESIDALCDAMRDFNGGVVLVSHDARLIETTNCQLWVVEDQNVTPWEKGFSHYRSHLLQKLEEQLAVIMPGSGERPGEKKK